MKREEANPEQMDGYRVAPLSRHPTGFPIFLASGELEAADGYAAGDPHEVAGKLGSAFQRRRIECTRELLARALGGGRGDGARILDVGCGEGHLTEQVRRKLPGAEIWANDRSTSAIVTAMAAYPGIRFAVADGRRLPHEDGFFDCVISGNVVEHVESPLELLREAARVTRPGGHLVLSTPSRFRLGNLLRALTGRPFERMAADHVTEYTVGQLEDLLRAAGYAPREVLSRALEGRERSIKGLLRRALIRPVVSQGLHALGASGYTLESTVFLLAERAGTEGSDG
jgi:ubiquinone/menaquinone biosynthesis C-methylase UbiE